jgi:hypothetical protein
MSLEPASIKLLKEIIYATRLTEEGFMYTSESARAELISQGLVEPNKEMVDPANPSNVATRATEKGLNSMNEATNSEFEIESNVPMPKQTRSTSTPKYPIDQLEIGDCFHVSPNDGEDAETLGKRLASVISNANQKHRASKSPQKFEKRIRKSRKTGEENEVSVEVMVPLRRFTARRVTDDDPKGTGLRIYRVALPTVEAA